MAKKPSRVRIPMMSCQEDEDGDPVGRSGPATVLTGLPRTIRRHELWLIAPLADDAINEMEKRVNSPVASISRLDVCCGTWERTRHGSSDVARHIWQGERRSCLARTSTHAQRAR